MALRTLSTAVAFVMTLALAPVAFGQGGVPGPLPSSIITSFKTPPLATSDTILVPIDFHMSVPNPLVPGGVAGWAGVSVSLHLLDSTEQDILGVFNAGALVAPGFIPGSVFGPTSAQAVSAPLSLNFWDPQAPISGRPVFLSSHIPVGTISLHAKNTLPSNNSDVDMTLKFWNMWHLGPCPTPCAAASQFFSIPESASIWGVITAPGSGFIPASVLPTPFAQPSDVITPGGDAHWTWVHLTNPTLIHITTGPGSFVWRTLVNTASVGVEHVPEPSSGLLVAAGLALVAVSRRRAAYRRDLE